MDTTEDENKPDEKKFPENRPDLDSKVNKAHSSINQINEEIKNPQKDKGPRPELKPKGAPPSIKRSTNIPGLKREKENIIDNTLNEVDHGLKGASDKKAAKNYRENTLENLDPNQYKSLSSEDLKKAQFEKKDINNSQKVADALLQKQKQKNGGKGPEPPSGNKSEVKPQSQNRFENSLAYNKFKENSETITKNPSKDNPSASKGTDKPMSMSARFSQGLGYNQMKNGGNNSPGKSPSPTKSTGKGGGSPGKGED